MTAIDMARPDALADFGIALAVSEAGGARITWTGLSLGTPQSMSPSRPHDAHDAPALGKRLSTPIA